MPKRLVLVVVLLLCYCSTSLKITACFTRPIATKAVAAPPTPSTHSEILYWRRTDQRVRCRAADSLQDSF